MARTRSLGFEPWRASMPARTVASTLGAGAEAGRAETWATGGPRDALTAGLAAAAAPSGVGRMRCERVASWSRPFEPTNDGAS